MKYNIYICNILYIFTALVIREDGGVKWPKLSKSSGGKRRQKECQVPRYLIAYHVSSYSKIILSVCKSTQLYTVPLWLFR